MVNNMTEFPSVSVIIPTFNRAGLIAESIQSVLDQDIPNCDIEIIVVDDGSTDNTREVVLGFGSKIKYICQQNAGAGAARNRGIEEAQNEWLAFLDSDDIWLPFKLSLQFSVLRAFPAYKAVHSDFYIFDKTGVISNNGLHTWAGMGIKGSIRAWSDVYSKQYSSRDFGITYNNDSFDIYTGNLFSAELKNNYISAWTLLAKRECFEKKIRFSESYLTWEDYWLMAHLTQDCDLVFMDIATAGNRSHAGNRLTQVEYLTKLRYHIDICKKIYFSSQSPNRPAIEEIEREYKRLLILLYKEYLKKGMRSEAEATYKMMKSINNSYCDNTFWFYRLCSLLPFNAIKMLVSLKRMLLSWKN